MSCRSVLPASHRPSGAPFCTTLPNDFIACKGESMTIKRIQPGPRMSQAVVHNGTVYLAGLVADDANADLKGQTKQILDKIDALLKEAGSDKSKILSANIWLTDIRNWAEMNTVWDAWLS